MQIRLLVLLFFFCGTFVFLPQIAFSHDFPNPQIRSDPYSSPVAGSCLGIPDTQYEHVEGYNGDGVYVLGQARRVGDGKVEGCFFDERKQEVQWFVGEWLSTCHFEAYDKNGRYFSLETDACWCKRCF